MRSLIQKLSQTILIIVLPLVVLAGSLGVANETSAAIISGWETESAVVKTATGTSWPAYAAYPYTVYNLRDDGKTVLISGQEVGGFFGYYWDNVSSEWISDQSLVAGLNNHAWNEAPALAYNVLGDNKWTLISHVGSVFYGYYWNGSQWVSDDARVVGLSASGKTSHVFIDNLTGDGKWTLITGTDNGVLKAFYWDGTQWIEESSRVSGIPDVGRDTGVAAGFNVTDDNKWTLIAVDNGLTIATPPRGFYWDGASWIEDGSRVVGFSPNITFVKPTLGYNIQGDNKWSLLSGRAGKYYMLGYKYNTVDTENFSQFSSVSSFSPLATTVNVNFSYPKAWDYRIKYSVNSDMSNASFSDWIKDVASADYKLRYLKPATTYYYQILAYVPWYVNYYASSNINSFTTMSAQNYIFVNSGQSIQNAVETLPLEGGTIELAEGIHNINSAVRIWGNNIILKGQGTNLTTISVSADIDKVIYISRYDDFIERRDWMYASGYKLNTFHQYSEDFPDDFVRNVVVEHLNITTTSSNTDAVSALVGRDILISNVNIKKSGALGGKGIHFAYTRDSIVKDSIFDNLGLGIYYWSTEKNDIINNIITNVSEGLEYNNGWTFSTPMIVKGNSIKNTRVDGMFIYGASNLNISNNIVESAASLKGANAGITLYMAKNVIVENNILKNNSNDGIRVSVKNNYIPPQINGGSHVIKNNIILNNLANGILFYDEYSNPLSIQASVLFNTIYANGQDGIDNSQGHNVTIKNNIISNNSRYGINGINTLNTYNDVYNNTTANYLNALAGTGDISTNPLFVNSANGDFHLQSQAGRWNGATWVNDSVTSPAIASGDPTTVIANCPTWGCPSRIEMGAYGNTTEASQGFISPTPVPSITPTPSLTPTSTPTLTPTPTASLTPTPAPKLSADLNSDGKVNSQDFAILMSAWNSITKPKADINQDGLVDSLDFGLMMSFWG